MKTNTLLLFILTFTLASCTSLYRGRTVRVKKSATTVESLSGTSTSSSKDASISDYALPTLSEDELEPMPIPGADTLVSKKRVFHNTIKKIEYIKSVIADDTSYTLYGDSLKTADLEEAKKKYKTANNMTIWAVACLLVSPFTFFFGLIAAVLLSFLAVRIYREYINPGVNERYGVALVTFIVSTLLVILGAAILLSFIGAFVI
jgi:hypothetical protein